MISIRCAANPQSTFCYCETANRCRPIATLVILPGSKTTISDLAALRRFGWDADIIAHTRRGGQVLGLCGGYQMLGTTIADPEGIEGPAQTVPGLGLLNVETVLRGPKQLRAVSGMTPRR